MSHLSILTVPGLDVRSDWRGVHNRLLNEFPAVTNVLATTMPETLLIVHDDEEQCVDRHRRGNRARLAPATGAD